MHRLECLSGQNSWHARWGIISLALLPAALLMGQASPPTTVEEVRAHRFVLVDGGGKPRGGLTVSPDGLALLILADPNGRPRVSLTVAADGVPSVAVYTAGGKRRVLLGLDAADSPLLILTDKEDTAVAAALTVTGDGSPALTFFDKEKKQRLLLGIAGDEPNLALTGRDGKSAAVLAIDSDIPRLALADRTGTERVWVAIRDDSPVVMFFDQHRMARSGFTSINNDSGVAVMSEASGSVPGLVLFNKDKKIVWSAP